MAVTFGEFSSLNLPDRPCSEAKVGKGSNNITINRYSLDYIVDDDIFNNNNNNQVQL